MPDPLPGTGRILIAQLRYQLTLITALPPCSSSDC